MKNNKGFTLIELMIVIAIMGILVMIATPFYRDYTNRAYVAEGLSLFSVIKERIVDLHATTGKLPQDYKDIGYTLADLVVGNGYGVPLEAQKAYAVGVTYINVGLAFIYYDFSDHPRPAGVVHDPSYDVLELPIMFYVTKGGQVGFLCGDRASFYDIPPVSELEFIPTPISPAVYGRSIKTAWQPPVCRM